VSARKVLALAAGLALLLGGLTGCTGGADDSRPTLRDVAALLARHGRAVVEHDRQAFLADVDGSDHAVSFWRRQAAEYANLARLPIASWSYRVDSRTGDRKAEAAAGRRLAAKALVVRIDLRYALRRADPVPSTRSLWWTFVRRDGHVVVAGDDALAEAGGVSWRGPWDFGALTVVRGTSCLVMGHADASVLRPIADAVDAAVPAVSAVWRAPWTKYVAVVVPGTVEELDSTVGPSSPVTSDVAAAAIADGADPVTGNVPGQRLVVNPDALDQLTAVGRQIVVRHEVTHVAAARATTEATPPWVREGFAEYVGNLGSGQPPRIAAAELRADVAAGRRPRALPQPADFDTGGAVAQAYQEAWLAARLIADEAGVAGLVRFYRVVGADVTDPAGAAARGLRAVLNLTPAQFTARWRDYLGRVLG
jgi:hypothetical protein